MFDKDTAHYLKGSFIKAKRPKKNIIAAILSSLVVFAILFGTAATTYLEIDRARVAHADEEDQKQKLLDAAREFGAGGDQENFEKSITKAFVNGEGKDDYNNFGYVLRRLFTIHYMNKTEKGVPAGGFKKRDYICDLNEPGAGTIVYHNCDIPNIITEFLQGIVFMATPGGIQGGTTQSAKLPLNFGASSYIPGEEVPVDPNARGAKYTALELYGYNLRYTTYFGEWDNIQVMTQARALANFGIMDGLRLGFASVINGITGGLEAGINGAIEGFKNGGVLGGLWGGVSSTFRGSSAAVLNTILDTSDLNVANMYGWKREGFGRTAYNTRELTQDEVQRNIYLMVADYLNKVKPVDAVLPQEFLDIQNIPELPKEAISKCTIYFERNGKETSQQWGSTTTAPGPTEAECKAQAISVKPTDWTKEKYTWSKEGTQKEETLKQWKENNSEFFDAAIKYTIECEIDENKESTKDEELAAFASCWGPKWEASKKRVLKDEQTTIVDDWWKDRLSQKEIKKYIAENPDMNPSAPWNRYVCLDSEGKEQVIKEVTLGDVDTQKLFKVAYNSRGQLKEGCMPIRPPIQNGFFGNGYQDGVKVPVDTRNEVSTLAGLPIIYNPVVAGNAFANIGLSVSQFSTKISNTVIGVAFSPMLDKLGVKDKVVFLIENFRDSLYFPLITMVIAAGALYIFFSTLKNRNYSQGLISLLMIVITFVGSVIVLYKPNLLVRIVDEGPAYVETTIVGTLFGLTSEDNDALCTATQSPPAEGEWVDIEGKSLTNPQSNVRTMQCQVWRTWVLEPWVGGQFGTGYDNVNARNSESTGGKLQNSAANATLVGDASVNMGGGVIINNWALYQIEVMTSGTTTHLDTSETTGRTSKELYRLVDVQAGPNNGAGTDSTYFEAWTGVNPLSRIMIALISVPSSIIGLVAIVLFAMTKLILTFTSIILLMMLPIMLLIGAFPNMGRTQLKGYVGTLISLMYQRIILVTLLALMLRITVSFAAAMSSPIMASFMTLVLSSLFIMKRKDLLKLAHADVQKSMGSHFTSAFARDEDAGFKKFRDSLPRGVQNYYDRNQAARRGMVAGAVGGFMAGGRAGAVDGARNQMKARKDAIARTQRRTGLGSIATFNNARNEGIKSARGQLYDRDRYDVQRNAEFLVTESLIKDKKEYHRHFGNPSQKEIEVRKFTFDMEDKNDVKDLHRLIDIKNEIDAIENKEYGDNLKLDVTTKDFRKDLSDRRQEKVIKSMGDDQDKIENERLLDEARIKELNDERENIIDRVKERYERSNRNDRNITRRDLGASMRRMMEERSQEDSQSRSYLSDAEYRRNWVKVKVERIKGQDDDDDSDTDDDYYEEERQ